MEDSSPVLNNSSFEHPKDRKLLHQHQDGWYEVIQRWSDLLGNSLSQETQEQKSSEEYRMPGAFDDQILLAEIPDNVVEDIQLLHQDLQGAAHQEDPLQPLQPFPQEEELVH